jgi:AcrR family transcriptional regulator
MQATVPIPDPGARRRRVPAMAPEERKAALVAATVPLVRAYGLDVSTRQIADAAGVAEGTIFRAFGDKASLVRAAVIAAFDPEPLVAELHAAAAAGDLRTRLAAMVDLLRARLSANEPIVAATRMVAGAPDAQEFLQRLTEARHRIMAALAAAMAPDAAHLRRDPDSAARLLFMLVMGTVHRGLAQHSTLSDLDSDEVVSLLLDGLLVRPARAPDATGDPT